MAFGTLFGIGCCNCMTTAPGKGVTLPQCFCEVPATLSMISNAPDCNYRMFQSCTIQYGPPPPAMVAFGFSSDVFTSTEMFTDPISNSDFFYYFSCNYNQFYLTRIFPTSPFGSPYRDGLLYNWVVGGYGNTCDPFALLIGQPFPGSDADCSVQILAATTQVPPATGPASSNPPPAGGGGGGS